MGFAKTGQWRLLSSCQGKVGATVGSDSVKHLLVQPMADVQLGISFSCIAFCPLLLTWVLCCLPELLLCPWPALSKPVIPELPFLDPQQMTFAFYSF